MLNIQSYNEKTISIERIILSTLLSDANQISQCDLEVEMFTYPSHRVIYQKIKTIYQNNGFLDMVELFSQCENEYGLCDYIFKLQEEYYSSSNFYFYVAKLQEIYKLSLVSKEILKCQNGEIEFDEMTTEINKISSQYCESNDSDMLSAYEMYELITTDATKLKFKEFDWMQNKIGLIEKTLNIISARTSVGKSAFALNLLNDLSDTYKCIYLNMEMTERELYQRLVSINSEVPIDEFPNVRMKRDKNARVNEAIQKVRNKKIKIYNGSKGINGIRKIIQKESRDGHCIVFVDYIGYVSTRKGQNDRERIGEATRMLQIMSKDFNCTIFVLAQLNRDGTEAPSLTHLKDSGELEQTGHAILFLHNPNVDISNQTPKYQLIVAKNRSGRLGAFDILFEKNIQKFKEI